jgi:hypothetical protein
MLINFLNKNKIIIISIILILLLLFLLVLLLNMNNKMNNKIKENYNDEDVFYLSDMRIRDYQDVISITESQVINKNFLYLNDQNKN